MTLENWLMIAVIISTLIAPTIAELVKPLIQPTPAPEANQPKNLIHRIGGRLIRLAASPWILPPLGIVYDIGVLVWAVRSSAPVTRGVVFMIASASVGIAWNILNMNVLLMTASNREMTASNRERAEIFSTLVDIVKLQGESIGNQGKTIGAILERISTIEHRNEVIDAKQGQPLDTPTSALRRLLAAVKNLLGP